MMLHFKFTTLLVIATFFSSVSVNGQIESFRSINVQGQYDLVMGSTHSFEFVILDTSSVVLWQEQHLSVQFTDEGSFNLFLGKGDLIGGVIPQFELIDWKKVQVISIWNIDGSPYLIGEFEPVSVSYAFHSLSIEYIPSVSELSDVSGGLINTYLLKFDGTGFVISPDLLADTVSYSWDFGTTMHSDTASIGLINQVYVDTSGFASIVDSVLFADTLQSVNQSDSTNYSDSTGIVSVAINNWNINGNFGLSSSNFVGTSSNENFYLGTNSQKRWTIGIGNQIFNSGPTTGFHLSSDDGVLFQTTSSGNIGTLSGTYLYFNGANSSLGISNTTLVRGVDTTMASYSFHFGENVSSSGNYAVIFGKNSRGDSSITAGTLYEPISSTAFGRYCIVSRYCVAIGDSITANYYRNVGIGNHIIANTASASVGIGTNVVSTGATGWAAGNRVTASGHFSTALGSNVSTDGYLGAFVYGDASSTDTVKSTANHQFMVRAEGGIFFYSSSDLLTGVQVSSGGGSWSMVSDRNKKENIYSLDGSAILHPIMSIHVCSWNYKGNDVVHVGPMAQDFHTAFGLGESETRINMIDIDGSIFLGIKGLNEYLNHLEFTDEIDILNTEIEQEQKEFIDINNRINSLYEKLDH